jgi:hypothetical protein
MDALAVGGIRPDRFLSIEQIETELPAAVRLFATSAIRIVLEETLESYCRREESRLAVQLIFKGESFPESVNVLAAAVGCTPKRLRGYLKQDLGLLPGTLLRWSILVRALELSGHALRRSEIVATLGIDDTTLDRDARNLLGLTFGQVRAEGARPVCIRLLELVTKHTQRSV